MERSFPSVSVIFFVFSLAPLGRGGCRFVFLFFSLFSLIKSLFIKKIYHTNDS